MEYLQTFEGYQDRVEKFQKLSTTIYEVFRDLIEQGFTIRLETDGDTLQVYIQKSRKSKYHHFEVSEIKETLLFAIPYLKDIGLKLDKIKRGLTEYESLQQFIRFSLNGDDMPVCLIFSLID